MENYVPIIEEINKAESMMTGEQKRLSRARENELIKWCENDLTLRKETIDHWDVIFRERNKGKMSTFGEHSAGLNYEKARAEELKRSIARLKEPTHPMNFDATRIAVLAHEIEPYEPTAQEIKQAEENMTLVQREQVLAQELRYIFSESEYHEFDPDEYLLDFYKKNVNKENREISRPNRQGFGEISSGEAHNIVWHYTTLAHAALYFDQDIELANDIFWKGRCAVNGVNIIRRGNGDCACDYAYSLMYNATEVGLENIAKSISGSFYCPDFDTQRPVHLDYKGYKDYYFQKTRVDTLLESIKNRAAALKNENETLVASSVEKLSNDNLSKDQEREIFDSLDIKSAEKVKTRLQSLKDAKENNGENLLRQKYLLLEPKLKKFSLIGYSERKESLPEGNFLSMLQRKLMATGSSSVESENLYLAYDKQRVEYERDDEKKKNGSSYAMLPKRKTNEVLTDYEKNSAVHRIYNGEIGADGERYRSLRLTKLALELNSLKPGHPKITEILKNTELAAKNADVRSWKTHCRLNIAFAKMILGQDNSEILDQAFRTSLVLSGYDGFSSYERVEILATIAKLEVLAGRDPEKIYPKIIECAWVFKGVQNGLDGYYSYESREYYEETVKILREQIEMLKEVMVLKNKELKE